MKQTYKTFIDIDKHGTILDDNSTFIFKRHKIKNVKFPKKVLTVEYANDYYWSVEYRGQEYFTVIDTGNFYKIEFGHINDNDINEDFNISYCLFDVLLEGLKDVKKNNEKNGWYKTKVSSSKISKLD